MDPRVKPAGDERSLLPRTVIAGLDPSIFFARNSIAKKLDSQVRPAHGGRPLRARLISA
jgi:hypothetical protein